MSDFYDCIVIGKGLIGSAAAKYLGIAGLRTAVIGPDEPQDRRTHKGVFAAHYDSSRTTRTIDVDPAWSILARRSQDRYADIESESGVTFHSPVGRLRVTGDANDPVIKQEKQIAAELALDVEALAPKDIAARFPFLQTKMAVAGLLEAAPSGYINPRELIRAQLAIAEASDVSVLRKVIVKLGQQGDEWVCTDQSGNTHNARRVLVTAGVYSNMLLPRAVAFRMLRETLLLAEIDAHDAKALSSMPAIGYRRTSFEDPLINDDGVYLFPPIQYPDGRRYLKIGLNGTPDREFETGAEITQWFHGDGDEDIVNALHRALAAILPDVTLKQVTGKPCIHAYTVHNRPYIGRISVSGLHIAAGGCGEAAKSSDEIGRLAAELITEKGWKDNELHPDDFMVVAAKTRN